MGMPYFTMCSKAVHVPLTSPIIFHLSSGITCPEFKISALGVSVNVLGATVKSVPLKSTSIPRTWSKTFYCTFIVIKHQNVLEVPEQSSRAVSFKYVAFS